MGPVSAPLSKLDLAIFVIRVKTIFGVDGGWTRLQVFTGAGSTSQSSADGALRHPIPLPVAQPSSDPWAGFGGNYTLFGYFSPHLVSATCSPTEQRSAMGAQRRGGSTKGGRWWEQHRSSPSAGQTSAKACALCVSTSKVCKSQVALRAFPLQMEKHLLHVK